MLAENAHISVTPRNISLEHNENIVDVTVPSPFGMYNFYKIIFEIGLAIL